jgi:TolB-like protein/class 3 adenylate cyclase
VTTRRLAAILAADVVSYSRLMGIDEVGTLRALKAIRRELTDPAIVRNKGRIVKTTGDGLLVEFASVVGAVVCAVEIQHGTFIRNVGTPDPKHLVFRVGVNVGDIIVEDDDVFGDDINIAARLEALCDPGGVFISHTAYDQIRHRLPLTFTDFGEQTVKNISRPIRVYGLTAVDIAALPEQSTWKSGETGELEGKPSSNTGRNTHARTAVSPPSLSLAVMPFTNLYGDAGQDYFADGLVDSLTTDLSRHIQNLFVVDRGSAFDYKGRSFDPRQVRNELGVAYLLQGSVQRSGSRVRVNAHLTDTETGSHLWADRFDGDSTDLLSLQDEITARIANSLGEAIYVESARASENRSSDPTVADLLMRGFAAFHLGDRTKAALDGAEPFFRRALALEADNPDAMIGLGATMTGRIQNFGIYYHSRDELHEEINTARTLLNQGLSLRPYSAVGRNAKGVLFASEQRWREALQECEVAHSLDPSSALYCNTVGVPITALGDPEKALPYFHEGIKRSPRDPIMGILRSGLGRAHLLLGHWDEALDANIKARAKTPGFLWIHTGLAAAYAHKNNIEAATASLQDALKIQPRLSFSWYKDHHFSIEPAYLQLAEPTLYAGLRLAGLPE